VAPLDRNHPVEHEAQVARSDLAQPLVQREVEQLVEHERARERGLDPVHRHPAAAKAP
jgi:hypothetical protein